MKPALFLTGATGFVGTELLRRIDSRQFERIVCLVRRPEAIPSPLRETEGLQLVVGDLADTGAYAPALSECGTVIHLAAATGKTRRDEYFRTNRNGTRSLVHAAREAGVELFLFVSSIAVRFSDQTHYHYAHSKKAAEEVVAQSGLPFTIVRPTMIFGRSSPVFEGLKKLAGLPIVPIIGSGAVAVQPVDVGDLARCLLTLATRGRGENETVEIGGPETITLRELLARIRRIYFGKPLRSVRLPLAPVRGMLALCERCLLPVLPMTAGQLASFANDSTAQPHALHGGLLADHVRGMLDIDDMLRKEAAVD